MPSTEDAEPDPGALLEGTEAAEREEIAKDAWLKSPEAVQQRTESRTAFDELTGNEAELTLGSVFPESLKLLDGDPARALSDLQVEEVVGEFAALVADREGGTELVESPIPIRSQVAGEEGEPLDLDLTESPAGFESKTPAAEIKLPSTLAGEIKVGEVAVSALPGNAEVPATRFGDKDLFFPNTDTDTDMFLAPLATGVEIFEQLRSPKSPEQFRYGLTLPKGAILRSDKEGGAEVVDSEGKRIAAVPAPSATDAQGTAVPVSMAIEESAVVVQVAHGSMDLAYPILLDPTVDDAWYWENTNVGLNYWHWKETADYEEGTWCTKACWGHGLYARSKGENYWYGANTYGHWIYDAPNTTAYIAAATFWTIKGETYNCLTQQPHGYVGIYNVSSGSYNSLGVWSPPQGYSPNFQTGWVGGVGTRLAVVGIGTGGSPSQLACGHDFWVAGAMLNQDDPENPSAWGTGLPNGGGWFSEEAGAFNLGAHAYDPGLGVKKITFTREGQPNSYEWSVGCNGTAASRCPENRSEYANVSALSFDEGKNKATITAEDATGKKASSTFYTYVDRTKPEVDLTGQLATATEEDKGAEQGDKKVEELSLPVYNLNIKATDVGTSGTTEKKMRSGVRKVEVWLDKDKVQEWTQPCSDSCSMEKSYVLKLNNLDSGKHKLKVLATDGVNKTREREIEFEHIPATGMKDEYVMQYFPLPDGSGNEAEEENPYRPELAVNVINGNLVYREKDVDVEGYAVDLEVERYYNSLLPEEENTEWGDGWTLAQTPELQPEPGPGAPDEALMVRPSGAVEGAIELPAVAGGEKFDPELQAVVSKEADGGFEVTDATGETDTSLVFDEDGTVEELKTDGEAAVDYEFDAGGALEEIAVEDPGSVTGDLDEIVERDTLEDITPTYQSSFGSQGTGNGQFKVLTDIAADPTDGSLWAADDENNRVQHFSAAGTYLGKFSTCADPGAVELDSKGDLFVACSMTGSVVKYSDTGTQLKTLATFGSGNAQVRFPLDVAIDQQGRIYVADNENDRVVVFDAAGNWLKAIPLGTWGRPWGLAIATNGNILVAEPLGQRVSIFDPSGTRIETFGKGGTRQGEFDRPTDVEVDHNGYIFVSDPGNRRIQIFNPQGEYVAQFGEVGTGDGQFSTEHWMRIATNAGGEIFVTDQGGSRVQRWTGSNYHANYKASFGAQGTGDGQFKVLTDVGTDPTDGSLWVTDDDNDRLQHFSATGTYLGKFSTCLDPGAVELNANGDLFVACSGSGSVRKYSDTGTLLKTLATFGSGNAQVRFPLDLTFNPEGKLWVADNENERLVQFDAAGNWIKSVPLGAWARPWGIAADADGNIWAAEPIHHRVSVYSPAGVLLNRFGTQGSGPGQFEWPSDVEIDPHGYAWVPDGGNNRVQIFNPLGEYVTRFGRTGSGAGEFNTYWWMRLSMNAEGDLFVTDQGNSRVVRWQEPPRLKLDYVPKYNNDPDVQVDVAGGLVESVEGLEAGEHVYEHSGDLLTSHSDADGETEYQYDGSGRMTYVKLPNGTWAKIAYGVTDGRVTSVEVAPYGSNAKKTSFKYTDSPRRTEVVLPLDPVVTYDIGEDGSVLISRNAVQPPEFKDFSGTFYDVGNRETATPINLGDYNLTVQAYSIEGIASIHMYANGNQEISSKTCPQVYVEPAACKNVPDEWVAHTSDLAPGIMNLEVVIEDRNKKVSSKRFWVNIPYTPPPAPDQVATPKHAEVLNFREEHGLDLDLDPIQDEFELNDRVYDTINDWIQGDPVAVASMERWGAPLRTPEVAELEWRIAYWRQAAEVVPSWAAANAAGTYAGVYLDERAGGKVVVGFTGAGAAASLAALESSAGLIAGPDRIVAMTPQPTHTLASLESLQQQVAEASVNYPAGLITGSSVDVPTNSVRVGASNVSQAKTLLTGSFGQQVPLTVYFQPSRRELKGSRERSYGMVRAGDETIHPLYTESNYGGPCTSAFGAFEKAKKPGNGEPVVRLFNLGAGHCGQVGRMVKRRAPSQEKTDIGEVTRNGYEDPGDPGPEVDAAATRLEKPNYVARQIFQAEGMPLIDVTSAWVPAVGTNLCFSGRTSKNIIRCGPVLGPPTSIISEGRLESEMCFKSYIWGGDSGSPVWVEGTGVGVGIAVTGFGGPDEPFLNQQEKEEEASSPEETCIALLLPYPGRSPEVSVLTNSDMAPLHLVTRDNARP